jgi:hypothetical protein
MTGEAASAESRGADQGSVQRQPRRRRIELPGRQTAGSQPALLWPRRGLAPAGRGCFRNRLATGPPRPAGALRVGNSVVPVQRRRAHRAPERRLVAGDRGERGLHVPGRQRRQRDDAQVRDQVARICSFPVDSSRHPHQRDGSGSLRRVRRRGHSGRKEDHPSAVGAGGRPTPSGRPPMPTRPRRPGTTAETRPQKIVTTAAQPLNDGGYGTCPLAQC